MKKLNQNNTIATKAMLTKTNTMKNKMNFFAKVFMLVVMIMLLMPQEVWGQIEPVLVGETWYSFYNNSKHTQNNNTGDFYEQSVYDPYEPTLHYKISTNSYTAIGIYDGTGKLDLKMSTDGTNYVQTINFYQKYFGSKKTDENTKQIPSNLKKFKFYRDKAYKINIWGGKGDPLNNGEYYIHYVWIQLAKHFYFDNNGSREESMSKTDFTSSSVQSDCQTPTTQSWTVKLHSFYIDNTDSITISKTSDPNNCFSVNKTTIYTSKSATTACGIYGTSTQSNNKPVNANSYEFTITYAPSFVTSGTSRTDNATFTVTANGKTYHVTVQGKCTVIKPTISINDLSNIYVFETYNLGLTTQNTNGTKHFFSRDESIATVNESTGVVTFLKAQNATLYATQDCNGIYTKATSADKTFTPAQVTPVLSWTGTELNRTFKGGDKVYLENYGWSSAEGTDVSKWQGISAKFTSSDISVASVGQESDGRWYVLMNGNGECDITMSVNIDNANAGNYKSYTPITHSVKVIKNSQTIVWNDDFSDMRIGGVKALTAKSMTTDSPARETGLPITYTPNPSGIVTISNGTLTCAKAGYVAVTASQGGNDGYYEAPDETKSFKVDFEVGKTFTFTGENVLVDGSKEETFDMTGLFLSSGESYTVTSSSPEFIIENSTIYNNQITIKFEPKAIKTDNDTEEKTSTITITDNGQTYSFKVKATAEKKDAGLTLEYIGETFAFSTITLSHSEATDAEVTLSASIGNIEDNTYKFQSTAPVTITATALANNKFKADSKTLNFTPKAVKPKIINWGGSYGDQKVGVSCPLGQADWDVDETVSGQPEKKEWGNEEVTITYTSSESRIAEVSGSDLVFHRAGLATITASIAEEKNHNASTNNPSKSVKVDFADEGVNCGTMYVGELPATADITDMIVPAGTLTYTTTDNDFSVDFSDNKIVVKYNPTTYKASSTGTITFTDTDGQKYHLNVSAGCVKHTPVIEWKDDKTLALSANPEMKSLNELLKNCSYCDGATIKTSDATVVTVFKSDGTPAGEGEGGETFWAHGNGEVEITIEIPETESQTSATSSETFTVSGIENTRVNWSQSLVFEYSGTQKTEQLSAVAYTMSGNVAIGQKITYEIISQNPSGIVSLTQDADGDFVSPLIINGTGTATIKAKAKATTSYAASESSVRTITINEPAQTGECIIELDDVTTTGGKTYNFVLNGHDANDYYYVDKIKYYYYVKGNKGRGILDGGDGTSKTIKAKINNTSITEKSYTCSAGVSIGLIGFEPEPVQDYDEITINTPPSTQNAATGITFSGDIGTNSSAFTKIKVTPSKYLKDASTTSHTFGSPTAIFVGQSETAQLTIAEYAFLNGNQVDMKLVNLNDDGDYAGGEFTILDKSDGDDWGKSCDYGKIKVHVQFAPLSGKDDAVHKCRIKITGTIGTNTTQPIYFTLEGHAQRNSQQVTWIQDLDNWNSQTGEVILAASSNQSDAQGTMEYDIVSQTAATSGETTGVVTKEGSKLIIHKAGTVKIKAKHPGDDKYLPAELERTFTISRVTPTITLSSEAGAIGEEITAIYGDEAITIEGEAIYNSKAISGYRTGANELIVLTPDATGVVSVTGKTINLLKAGTAKVTAKVETDDVVNEATKTFNVKVNPATQSLIWDVIADVPAGQYGDNPVTINLEDNCKSHDDSHNIDIAGDLNKTFTITGWNCCNGKTGNEVAYIDGNTLYITGAYTGTITITASQDGKNKNNNDSEDYTEASETTTVTIVPITPTITFEPKSPIHYLEEITLSATSSTGNYSHNLTAADFALENGTGSASLTNGILKGTGVGIVKVIASQQNDCQVKDIQPVEKEITIIANNQILEWDQTFANVKTLDNVADIELTAWSKDDYTKNPSNLAINYTLSDETSDCGTIATKTENEGKQYLHITGVGPGTVTIHAVPESNANYNPVSEKTKTITIEKSTPTIQLSYTPTNGSKTVLSSQGTINATYGEQPYIIEGVAIYNNGIVEGYTVGTNGKIVLTSGATDVVSVTGNNTLNFLKQGTAVITASIAEDCLVKDVANFTLTVNVGRATPTISWQTPPHNAKFNDNGNTQTVAAQAAETDDTFSFTYAISNANPADVASINANTGVITINKAGTFKVTATNVMTDKYGATNIESELITISKCQTGAITINGNNTMRYGTSQTLTCTTTNTEAGQSPQYTYSSNPAGMVNAATGVVTANVTGTITITATLAATTSYEEISNTFDIAVVKADQRVVWGNVSSSKLKTTDTGTGILLTANAYNAHLTDNVATDGSIEFEITDGSDYAEVKNIDNQWRLVSKVNGVHTISVKAKSTGTDNYNPGESSEIKTFEMEKAEPTIAWTTEPKETMTFVERMPIAAVVTGNTDNNSVTYSIENSTGSATIDATSGTNKIKPTSVGTIIVNARSLETANFKQVTTSKTVTITNAEFTFTIDNISMHYGDPELTITPQTGGLKGYDATYRIESSDYQYIANTNGEIVDGKINVLKAKPNGTITVTPTFNLSNYTITSQPFTVTIDKAVQSLTWNTAEIDIPATQIGTTMKISAPNIGFKYSGIENAINYTYDSEYMTINAIPDNTVEINVKFLKYTSDVLTVSASYTETEDVLGATTETPLSITLTLQPQKIVWDGETPTISNIYTTKSTDNILSTLKAVTRTTYDQPNNNVAKYRFETSNNCPSNATLITLKDNGDGSCNVKYKGDGSGHVKIIAYAETANGYQATKPEQEQTIEFDVLPAPATVAWNTDEFADAHYGDVIEMTPSVTPDKGNKVFAYTFEEGKNLTYQGNVLSIKDVATEGTTITALNTEDCFLAADVDGYTRSVTINKTGQEIVWGQEDMSLDVVDADDVQLTAYAIDSRHKDQSTTCLELTDDGKYITAKTAGDDNVTPSETGMKVTYIVEEQDGVCKVGDEKIVTVDETGLLHVTGNGTGQVKITPTVSEGAHYTSATGTPIIVTVSKVTPTVTVTGPVGPLNYGTGPHTLTASSEIGSYSSANDPNAAFTYTITEGTDVASINGDQLTILKAGTVKVTATQTENCIVNSATSADYGITIDEISPLLEFTFVPTDPIIFGDNSKYVTAVSASTPASTGAITYTSSNTAVATVDANTGVITPVAQGTFTVIANIAAVAGKWTAGQATSSQITINRADPQLEWKVEPQNATYDPANNFQNLSVTEISDAAPTFSVTPESPSTDGATIDQSGVLTITKVGTYKVTVTLAETKKYNRASIEKTIVISKANADFFTIADITLTYNDEAISLDNDISGGTLTLGTDYQVSYSVGDNGTDYFNVDDANKTINPLKANVDNSGNLVEMTLNASISGMTNYNDKQITGKVYVQRATQAIVWSDGIQTSYNTWNVSGEKTINLDDYTQSKDVSHSNADITPDLTKTYELVISNKGCNINDANVAYIDNDNVLHITGEASATLTIYAMQNGFDSNGENYTKIEKANNCSTVITINKITPTITFAPQNSMNYGDKVAVTASSALEGIYSSNADENNGITITSASNDAISISEGFMEAHGVTSGTGVTLTASQEDNCVVSGVNPVSENVTVVLGQQKMVWNGENTARIDVAGTQTFTFNPYAIDKLHTNQNGTWLELTSGEYPTGNTVEYVIGNVTLCESSTEADLVSVDENGVIRATGKGTGTVRIWAKANADSRYAEITDDGDKVYVDVTVNGVKPVIQSFDISSLNDIHYGDRVKLSSPKTNYFVNQGDNKTTFSYADNAAYGISAIGTDTMFDAKAVGTGYTIVATQEAIACFNQESDPYTSGTFNIAKSEQEIEWNGQSALSIAGVSNDYQMDGISLTAKAMDKRHKAGGSQTWLTNLETGLAVTYTFTDVTVEKCGSDVDIISIDKNGKLTATGLGSGTVTIIATQADGNENYSEITADEDKKSITVTVNKITPDLKIYGTEGSSLDGETLSVYYGDPEYTALACKVMFVGTNNELKNASGKTLYSIADIDLTDDGQGVVTINGKDISFNKEGLATITATLKADCRVSQNLTATFYVNVQKPAQEIKFEQDIENQTTLNYHDVALTAYSYDNVHNRKIEDLAVSYAISTSDGCGEIATYSDNTVHVTGLGAGTVTITASQAGDDRYGAAQDVQRTFTIDKETPTVDFTIAKVNGEDYSESTVIRYNDVLTLAGTSIVEGTSYDGHEHVTFKYNDEPISSNQVTVTDQQFTLQAVQAEDCIVIGGQSEVKNYSISNTPTEIRWTQTIADQTTTSPMQPMTLTAEVWDTQHNVKIDDATVTFSISGNTTTGCGDIATLSDENLLTVTGNGAGTVTLTASYSGENGKYDAAISVEKSFTITKVVPQFNWTEAGDLNATYGDNNVTATTTHDGTGTVTYGSNKPTVATIDKDGKITIVGAGTTTLSATLAADCKYEAVTTAITKTLTVAKATQTIDWDQTFGDDIDVMTKLSFTASSNIFNDGIYYTADPVGILGIDNQDHVAIDDNLVQILKSGTVNVTAHHPGDENHKSAVSETKQIVINKHTPRVVWDPDPTRTYEALTTTSLNAKTGGPYTYGDIMIGYEIVSTSPDGCASINGNTVTFNCQGTVVVRAKTIPNKEERYEEGSVEATLTIDPSRQGHTITWSQSPTENIDYKTQLTFSARSNQVTDNPDCDWYEVVTEAGDDSGVFGVDNDRHIIINNKGYVQITGAGKAHVRAHHPGNSVYAAAYSEVREIVVGKASPELNWTTAPTSIVYNGTLDLTQSYSAAVDNPFDGTYSYSSSETSIITVDNSGIVTAVGNANSRATVTVTMSKSNNYSDASISTTITIDKGTPDLAWNESFDFSSLTNKVDDFDLTGAATCSNVDNIIYSVEGNENVSVSEGNKLKIDYDGTDGVTFTLKATVNGGTNYDDLTISKEIKVTTLSPIEIIVQEGILDLGTTNPIVTSVTNDVDFLQLLTNSNAISCNYNNVTYTFVSSDENIAKFDNEGNIIAYKKSDEGLSITVTAHVDDLSDKQATMTIKIPRGTMVFQNAGTWDVNSNWLRTDMLPSAEDHNVSIAANCTVNVTTAECYDMEIAGNGTLTISTAGILNVADTLLNNDAGKLRIEADANGQGTLIFHNKKTMPMATVEMWCKGSETGTGADGGNINPNWQYRGIAVSSATLTENAPNLIYQWTEAAHASDAGTGITEQWTKVTDNTMSAWNGYAVAKYTDAEGNDYKTSASGALTNADQEIALAYTATQQSGNGVQTGFNLITNSYTAPIRISDIVFGDETEGVDDVMKGIVLFNTGSYAEWNASDKEILEGNTGPGQYLFLPKYTAEQIATTELIPSGESFFVVAYQTDKTVQIPYSAVDSLKRSGPLKMPERREIYGKLIIEVDGGEGADRLYLLENENRVRGFENGYDGPKYAGTKGNPMLYATTDDGRMCVSADSSLLGQYIGFAAGKHDVTYTMTFDASALSGYSELYLYDTREKRYTNILDGGTYTFKGLVSGEDRRFKIVGSREDGESVTGDDQTIIVTGNRFHVTGYDNADERIYLVDMTGKILWETSTAFGPWFDIPTDIPAGVYVIKTGNHTAKMAVK